MDQGNVDDFVLSKSTTLRPRKIARSKMFLDIKEKFQVPRKGRSITIHWDEKLLKTGNAMYSKEYIAILTSFEDNIELLVTTAFPSRTGLNQSNAVYNMLHDWEIADQCLVMCFEI